MVGRVRYGIWNGMEWSEASFRKRMWDVGGGLFGWVSHRSQLNLATITAFMGG